MSTDPLIDAPAVVCINEIGCTWAWFLSLGIELILFGAVCVVALVDTTYASETALGWLLLITGIAGLVHSCRSRGGSGFLLRLLSALFRGFIAYRLLSNPAGGAAALTLIVALFFIVAGLIRSIGASSLKLPHWRWSVFSGIVSFVLGILLLVQLPVSSISFISFALGLDMILDGTSLVILSVAIRSPKPFKVEARSA